MMLDYDPINSGDLQEIISGQYAVCIKPGHRWYGWFFFRHPDGQWVSFRKATAAELETIGNEIEKER